MTVTRQLVLIFVAAALSAVSSSSSSSSHLLAAAATGDGPAIGLPGCPTSCGDVQVPYPFGISPGCYLPGFRLSCDTSHTPPRLLLGGNNGILHHQLQVVDISLDSTTVRVVGPGITVKGSVSVADFAMANGTWGGQEWGLDDSDGDDGGVYVLSPAHNELILAGCQFLAELLVGGARVVSSCVSVCLHADEEPMLWEQKCSGVRCCQARIPVGRSSYDVRLMQLDDTFVRYRSTFRPVSVFIAEEGWFNGTNDDVLGPKAAAAATTAVPMVLAWAVRSTVICPEDLWGTGWCQRNHNSCSPSDYFIGGYTCQCSNGYKGNPYLPGGCQDIDECKLPTTTCYGNCTNMPGTFLCECPQGTSGDPLFQNGCTKPHGPPAGLIIGLGLGSVSMLLLLFLCIPIMINKLKARRMKRQRQRFFKQNRGQLLQQLISQKADIAERMIITLGELEKATNNFDKARELGGGGHGTVYKGILSNLHVVAIKKAKITVQREINQFINEVAILSQINHRNIVKLHGCCLETEVPLLVYEFISNGTLYDHLHVGASRSVSWRDRLRIAIETARAISYLHSFASMPIIHRDIKSPNILLDDNLAVKLSDFGASRYNICADENGVHASVQGTLGYLDPTYCHSRHPTEKSDVYSFGVLLIELLTRRKPASYRSAHGYSLVKHFMILILRGNDLASILDPQVTREGGGEVFDVALLAAICVKTMSDERPTMRKVELALEGFQTAREYCLWSSDVTDDDSGESCIPVNNDHLLQVKKWRQEAASSLGLVGEIWMN